MNLAISFEKNSILQDIIRSFLPNFDKRICTLTYGIDSQTPHCKRPFRESDVETDQFLEMNTPMATPNDKITPRVDEVLGLDVAKSILREAIVLPRLFPDLFKTSTYIHSRVKHTLRSNCSFSTTLDKNTIIWCMLK